MEQRGAPSSMSRVNPPKSSLMMACRVIVTVLALVPIDALSAVASGIAFACIPPLRLARQVTKAAQADASACSRKSDTLPVAQPFPPGIGGGGVAVEQGFCSARFKQHGKSLALCVIAIEAITSDCWAVRQQ